MRAASSRCVRPVRPRLRRTRLRKGSDSRSAACDLTMTGLRAPGRQSISLSFYPPADEAQPGDQRRPEQAQPGRGQSAWYERSLVSEPDRSRFRARTRSVSTRMTYLDPLQPPQPPGPIGSLLVHVLVDRREPTKVRIHVLKRLRNGCHQPADRQSVAEAILQVVSDHSSPDLQAQAVLALAEFTNIDGVQATLGGLALDP